MPFPRFIIDFDSTFVGVESLDVLAGIALTAHPEREARTAEVQRLTSLAMAGETSFADALARRLALIAPRREHIAALVERLHASISTSFLRNRELLRAQAENIWIVSAGFHEYVEPVVERFGLRPEQVLANRFRFEGDAIAGFDSDNPLAGDGGKVKAVGALGLAAPLVAIGDGMSDYELYEAGIADRFYAYTESVRREEVLAAAPQSAASFDEVLADLGLAATVAKALLLEGIHAEAVERLRAAGCETRREAGSPDAQALAALLAETTLLGIRSKTQVTTELLDRAPRLLALGAFCIGTNQIDLTACTRRGVAVFNAPFSNTRSVAELALAEIILLLRNLPAKMYAMHEGRWNKSAANSHEARGKTLGIVGYGKIGMQLSVLAEALGMRVRYFDLAERLAIGNAERCHSLAELLADADVVTLHVDGRNTNRGLMDAATIARMKPGAILVNLSRGYVVDPDALAAAITAGHIRGAALDVYPEEPASRQAEFKTPLANCDNVILTPHIGGSTEEAQLDIARYVAARLADYLANGATIGSVNLPELAAPRPPGTQRIAHLHENVPGLLAAINRVLAEHGLNVTGQHLGTTNEVGYVLTDVDNEPDAAALGELAAIPHTLHSRLLTLP